MIFCSIIKNKLYLLINNNRTSVFQLPLKIDLSRFSFQEMMQEQIDTSSAYILFYEQRDLNSGAFMPDITGHEPDTTEITDEFESEFKKMCTLQWTGDASHASVNVFSVISQLDICMFVVFSSTPGGHIWNHYLRDRWVLVSSSKNAYSSEGAFLFQWRVSGSRLRHNLKQQLATRGRCRTPISHGREKSRLYMVFHF